MGLGGPEGGFVLCAGLAVLEDEGLQLAISESAKICIAY